MTLSILLKNIRNLSILVVLVFSFNFALANIMTGKFMVVKGKVKIEGAKGIITEAKVGSVIQQGETVITETDSRAKIVMTDRNIINISPNTKLKIEKYTNSEKDKNVQLNLIEGKVRSNVEEKYDNKNSKFQIKTATAVAGVRGTQFVMIYNRITGVTQVITLRGQVLVQQFNPATGNAQNEVVVNKGEKSEVKEDATKPTDPVIVPNKEIKEIDQDTNVKRDNNAEGSGNRVVKDDKKDGKKDDKKDPNNASNEEGPKKEGPPVPPPVGEGPPLGAPTAQFPEKKNDQIGGAVQRRLEKSKVKIIVTPQ